jgi:hypothetical protein
MKFVWKISGFAKAENLQGKFHFRVLTNLVASTKHCKRMKNYREVHFQFKFTIFERKG